MDVGVSKNRGTPKSSVLIGFSIINHPFWGTPIFGNTHVFFFPAFWSCAGFTCGLWTLFHVLSATFLYGLSLGEMINGAFPKKRGGQAFTIQGGAQQKPVIHGVMGQGPL